MMLGSLRNFIPERSPIRLTYHRIAAFLAAAYHGFPSRKLAMIGVTGTSGKSSTVELIYHMLHCADKSAGSISGVQFHIKDRTYPNTTLRTTLRPWTTQKLLKQMVQDGVEVCVMEVSSHAIDQNRIFGIDFDTVVLTNIYDNEHLDYHENFADYVQTKVRLFENVNIGYRKTGRNKVIILNQDCPQFSAFDQSNADEKWTFSLRKQSTFMPSNVQYSAEGISFSLRVPNNQLDLKIPMVGRHNTENIMAAIATVQAHGVDFKTITASLNAFPGIPGRLEVIAGSHPFSLFVDFTYKPSALSSVLSTLNEIKGSKRLIIVWGGAGGRSETNWEESAEVIDRYADEVIITTDDPYDTDPQYISDVICKKINRTEGENFFEIDDRYEAIRYAIFTAEPGDIVLIAGRGHEPTQTIGTTKIPFDDREVCREILALAHERQVF